MPSLIGRLARISFRSEMLIFNLLGLVNSTLDWLPLKWSSEVESIENLPLTKENFAFDLISADRIRTILSWIVVTKVLVDNLCTLTYLSNICAVVRWSRPLLLVPWIVFSFLKNFILEVLIFAIGVLLALEEKLPLFLLVEFFIVKLVQFNLAGYTWYLNTRLYLYLKCRENSMKLGRGIKSDSIGRCGFHQAIRLRTKSLTTVLSSESTNSNVLFESTSRILNDRDLSPMAKAMKILEISEHEIIEAKERAQQEQTSKDEVSIFSDIHIGGSSKMDTCEAPDLPKKEESNNDLDNRNQLKRIEDKTASFYFLKSEVSMSERDSTIPPLIKADQMTETEETFANADIPKDEMKKERQLFYPILDTNTNNATSSCSPLSEMPERPCSSIMKKKEHRLCLPKNKSPNSECMRNSIRPPKNLGNDNAPNLSVEKCKQQSSNSPTGFTQANKSVTKIDTSVEITAANCTLFFDADDKSFVIEQKDCDDELSANNLSAKRKVCSDQELLDVDWVSPKIVKVEETVCASSPESTEHIDPGKSEAPKEKEKEKVAESSETNIDGQVKSLTTTRKSTYVQSMKSEESKPLGCKSPNTKPRSTYFSQMKDRPSFYTAGKMPSTEKENTEKQLRKKPSPRESNSKDSLSSNSSGIPADPDSFHSLNITVRSTKEEKLKSTIFKQPPTKPDPLPLAECMRGMNLKNVTIRNPLASVGGAIKSEQNARAKIEKTKSNKSSTEDRKQLTNTTTVGTEKTSSSSAGRAARFKEVKTRRASNEIDRSEDRNDSHLSRQQKEANILNAASFTEGTDPRFRDHWDKENIYSHGPVEVVQHQVFLFAPRKSEAVPAMNFEDTDDLRRPTSLLENSGQPLQEIDFRRRLTKFSTSKEEDGESSISAVCSKKIEGQQEGKDLMRIFAKEDVRNLTDPGTSTSSTATCTQIESPSQSTVIIDKFRTEDSSTSSEISSSLPNSLQIELEDTVAVPEDSLTESFSDNSSSNKLNITVTLSVDDSTLPLLANTECNSTLKLLHEPIVDLYQAIDSTTETTTNIEQEIKDSCDPSHVPSTDQSSEHHSNKSEEITERKKLDVPESDQHHLLEVNVIIDTPQETHQQKEETDEEKANVRSDSSGEVPDNESIKPSQMIDADETVTSNCQLAVQSEKLLATIEYSNTLDLPDVSPKVEEEMQPKVSRESDQLEVPALARSDKESGSEETCEIATGPYEETKRMESSPMTSPNEELEGEPIVAVEADNVPQPRLLLTTITLLFILLINFTLRFFYRSIIKPLCRYIFLPFRQVFPFAPRLNVPRIQEIETSDDLLFPTEGKSEDKESNETRRASQSLPQEDEAILPEPKTETEADNEAKGALKSLPNRFLQYRDERGNDSDIEDPFRTFETTKYNVRVLKNLPLLRDPACKPPTEQESLERTTAQLEHVLMSLHLTDSESSTCTGHQSKESEGTLSLGQASSFEDFPEDSIPQAESQV